ncbi:hypothetical protein BGZ94_003668 [Podila epigama]|nr:hypothetical protein BGZ94_003668 [Podila epigama]
MGRSPANKVLKWALHQSRSELQHRLNQMSLLGITPGLIHKAQAIMSQRYYGDITIVPDMGVEDYINIVSNPTPDSLIASTLKGEKATWPKISIIKNHCSIEHCLDDILYRLRLRRLEAFRAYPQTAAQAPKVSLVERPVLAHSATGTAPLRNSASLCFGQLGRSTSSPPSPTAAMKMSLNLTPVPATTTTTTIQPNIKFHAKSKSLQGSSQGFLPATTVHSGATINSTTPFTQSPSQSQSQSYGTSISYSSPRTSSETQRRAAETVHGSSFSATSSPASSRNGSRHSSFSSKPLHQSDSEPFRPQSMSVESSSSTSSSLSLSTDLATKSTSRRSSSSSSTNGGGGGGPSILSSSPAVEALFQVPESEQTGDQFGMSLSPVPSVLVPKKQNSKKQQHANATSSSSGSGRGHSSSRSKRNRQFQMTSLE